MRTLISISFGLMLAGCPNLPEGRFQCAEDSQCPGSMRCSPTDNRCYSVLPDAGGTDASDGAITDASDGDISDGAVGIEIPTTTCELQGEVGSRPFAIAHLRIPTKPDPEGALPSAGFNVDGFDSTSQDITGCNKADKAGGVDNAFAAVNDGLGPVFAMAGYSFGGSLESAIANDAINLEIVLGDWNMTASDPCVTVTIQGSVGGSAITPLSGRAPLVAGLVAYVTFGANLRLTSRVAVSPDGGTGCTQGCVNFDLPMVIHQTMARVRLSPDLMHVVSAASPDNTNSTMVGGYVRFTGSDALAFQPNLEALFTGIDPTLTGIVSNIFRQFLDLDTTPSLMACEALEVDGGLPTTADSFSTALLVSSVP